MGIHARQQAAEAGGRQYHTPETRQMVLREVLLQFMARPSDWEVLCVAGARPRGWPARFRTPSGPTELTQVVIVQNYQARVAGVR